MLSALHTYLTRDYIGTFSLTDELPPSDPTLPPVKADSLATLVTVNISAYSLVFS
ncbi:MAG: hypothetical protein MRZ40_09065 [Ligilactobacillus animalis]|uniref:hypothetical protein n=1 Tax=Ligilactobacillus animalis TaxID=1605 RepID=UPI00242DE60C|nr:hypothetical protein [Ligilactobacillus animalis]MCI5942700.1 hypothetical protein [Ligilactobacillus animalis]MDY2993528.1 hypothetical protein [Ligilactobacillus animalis]